MRSGILLRPVCSRFSCDAAKFREAPPRDSPKVGNAFNSSLHSQWSLSNVTKGAVDVNDQRLLQKQPTVPSFSGARLLSSLSALPTAPLSIPTLPTLSLLLCSLPAQPAGLCVTGAGPKCSSRQDPPRAPKAPPPLAARGWALLVWGPECSHSQRHHPTVSESLPFSEALYCHLSERGESRPGVRGAMNGRRLMGAAAAAAAAAAAGLVG
ncbi:hypothetical protein J1605_007764 [Eschrichtius robustus]|uniref:Uncharacterized protein n=1 Tax=Eschrichtius robustus TaxID=9764 RepID=A0AB34GYL7_ESCRO|nr:hypothetical protein J1605_011355 [Eschrichtius robustus]KAJ8784784.1 hypothetical protein J1605_007811 [Eschrichtius robustus]KAJ8785208.1 hypothetical protein J1605_007764 [Eschrichtius robustus]